MNNPIVPPRTKFTPVLSEIHKAYPHIESRHKYEFPNGYGASVVRIHDAWELAVLDSDGALDYSTPVTDDVVGWQGDEDIEQLLIQISELPAGDSGE